MTTDHERDVPKPLPPQLPVHLTQDEIEDIIDILTRELTGHHNRMESHLIDRPLPPSGVDTKRAVECAIAAKKVRTLRGHFHRAIGDDPNPRNS